MYPRFERELRPILKATELKERPHVLLIYGEADTVTPVHVGHEMHAALSPRTSSVELWTVPGAEHTFAMRAQRDAYAERVTAFLERAMRNSADDRNPAA